MSWAEEDFKTAVCTSKVRVKDVFFLKKKKHDARWKSLNKIKFCKPTRNNS